MSGTIRSYRDLEVWQRSVALATSIYQITAKFPKEELYGLTSQIRRAMVSVPSNLAEGHNRAGQDFARYVGIALGSVAELETQCLIAHNVGFLSAKDHHRLADELAQIGKMLWALRRSLRPSRPLTDS